MMRSFSTFSVCLFTMPIDLWTPTDAQNMKNVRFIYFACNAVSLSHRC